MRTLTVNRAELAKCLNIAVRTVAYLKANGVLTLARDREGKPLRGRYELQRNFTAYIQYLQDQHKAGDGEFEREKLRNRKLMAETDIAELTARELRGELLRGEDVLFVLNSRITGARAQLLAIPSRVSRLLIGETDHRRIHEILRDEIEAALRNISELREGDLRKQRRKHVRALSANNGHNTRGKRPRRK
jgi:phage terminase Nu1 subunit (DNA packaging protein)